MTKRNRLKPVDEWLTTFGWPLSDGKSITTIMVPLLNGILIALAILSTVGAFQSPLQPLAKHHVERHQSLPNSSTTAIRRLSLVLSAEDDSSKSGGTSLEEQGVVELPTGTEGAPQQRVVPTFLSQGEIDPETLSPDMSDPKQARVIIYIVLSLIPVLFLIPFMLGSRDLIPLDALPPVDI